MVATKKKMVTSRDGLALDVSRRPTRSAGHPRRGPRFSIRTTFVAIPAPRHDRARRPSGIVRTQAGRGAGAASQVGGSEAVSSTRRPRRRNADPAERVRRPGASNRVERRQSGGHAASGHRRTGFAGRGASKAARAGSPMGTTTSMRISRFSLPLASSNRNIDQFGGRESPDRAG